MKHTLALIICLTALGAANAQVWTNLPAERQAALVNAHRRYNFAASNLTAFRYVTNAVPSAWATNSTGEVSVTATTNKVVDANPPIATRQLFYSRFYTEADTSESVIRKRDAILWQKLMDANVQATEAIANDRESGR